MTGLSDLIGEIINNIKCAPLWMIFITDCLRLCIDQEEEDKKGGRKVIEKAVKKDACISK